LLSIRCFKIYCDPLPKGTPDGGTSPSGKDSKNAEDPAGSPSKKGVDLFAEPADKELSLATYIPPSWRPSNNQSTVSAVKSRFDEEFQKFFPLVDEDDITEETFPEVFTETASFRSPAHKAAFRMKQAVGENEVELIV
jgi:hypothetical protein